MQWDLLLLGLALFMIFEGMLPFAMPRAWRRALLQMSAQPDRVVRLMGAAVMGAGVVLLLVVNPG